MSDGVHMATGETVTYDKRLMPDTTKRAAISYKVEYPVIEDTPVVE